MKPRTPCETVEWRTVLLWIGCFGMWLACLFLLPFVSVLLAGAVLTLVLVLQSSLSHEALHGHPFPKVWANDAIAMVSLGLFIPYLRFRDTHLAHHIDENLTDPYDDPETNFCDPAVWAKTPNWWRRMLVLNNTLLGRMLIGPVISQVRFMQGDWRLMREGDRAVTMAWALHIPGCIFVLLCVWSSGFAIWGYVLCCYFAISVLKIRTFLEHRAHVDAPARTVIIDDNGVLAFLFLNNNLHGVHHLHPNVPWYGLPQLYRNNRATYDGFNEDYNYASYRSVFARYFVKTKDPVPHPLWPLE